MSDRSDKRSVPETEVSIDEKTLALSDNIREAMNVLLNEYVSDEEYEDDLRNILEDDEYLTEELVDKTAFLNFVESAPDGEFTDEDIEHAYLSVIDSFFELSKMISPLNGFGKDRLEAGLSLVNKFEKGYWAVSTKIVPENVSAFSELISIECYEDILAGRKKAIGALRHIGNEVYAAGVIVYSIYDDPDDDPLVNIDWIMVHDALREQGIGNFLMAQLIEEVNYAAITAELPVRQSDDDEELRDINITENFFDSWKFAFSLEYGSQFFISLSDAGRSEVIKKSKDSNVKCRSLNELGAGGDVMLRLFFKKRNQSYDTKITALPYDYYDRDVSCVTFMNEEISSVLLFHRSENGDYRYIACRGLDGENIKGVPEMIAYAYAAAAGREDGDHMISGYFESEEGYDIAKKLIPNARVPMTYRGIMYPPRELITSEEWGQLREKAGLSNDKLSDDEINEKTGLNNSVELVREYIINSGFRI